MNIKMKFFIIFALTHLVGWISGHGMMMDPVNRASRWRKDGSTPRDYNDMEGNCGGFQVQHRKYGGKCGMCGDPWGEPTPRTHEHGGSFGKGVIVQTYKQGALIDVTVKITANHLGYFSFKICNMDNEGESDACFDKNPVWTNQGSTFPLLAGMVGDITLKVQLPSNLACQHCVLQWTYTAGNNWGWCEDGTGRLGCGEQEHFIGCADIRILKA